MKTNDRQNRSGKIRPPGRMHFTVVAVALVGLLSFFLLLYGNYLWQNNFRRSVPLLDNLMYARISLAEGHIWLEEALSGNAMVHMDSVRSFYQQAEEGADACLQGRSALTGLPGLPLRNSELAEQINRFKWSIKRSASIAEKCWQSRQHEDLHQGQALDKQLWTAYHGGELLAGVISVTLQQQISKAITAQRNIFGLSLVLWGGILVSLCGSLYVAGRRQQQDRQALQESEGRLRLLSSHLLTAQEQERRRLSLELHDELGQSLTVLKLQIRGIEKQLTGDQENVKDSCSKTLDQVDQIIDGVRRLSRDLSPSVLEDLGLTNALLCLAEDFCTCADIHLASDVADIDGLFSREAEIVIYRVVQEALTNIGKHADAGRVWISVRSSPTTVSVSIQDDGKGIDGNKIAPAKISERGLGITAMHERARMLGATLDISSTKGSGTKVSLTAPIQQEY